MKLFFFLLTFCLLPSLSAQDVDFYEKTNIFLRQVIKEHKIDYLKARQLSEDQDHLRSLINAKTLSSLSSGERKAFLINAYNLFVVFDIAEYYPVWSVKAIPDFFILKKWSISDQLYSLDDIEKMILTIDADPRIHFALVCGAKDCPTLQTYAYVPHEIDKQLDQVTTNFINDLSKVLDYRGQLELSRIFSWKKEDFLIKSDIHSYINTYRYQKVNASSQPLYKEYDWSLNEYVAPPILEETAQRYYYSRLYSKGQYEAHLFNNYFTASDVPQFDGDFDKRSNFFTMWGQFLYGYSDKLNVGFDVRLRSVNQNFRENTSSWDAFKFRNEGLAADSTGRLFYSRTALTGIGPKAKYQPLKNIPNITFQHTLLIPLGKNLEGSVSEGYIDWNNPILINQAFYDQDLGSNLSLFIEFGLTIESLSGSLFRQSEGFYQLSTPTNIIMSYFMDDRSTLYGLINATPRWANTVNETLEVDRRSDSFNQFGLGYKYFFTDDLQMEVLYTVFNGTVHNRKASTFNIGFRYYGR